VLTAGEFCNRKVATTSKNESLVDAARRMRDRHVGSLVIIDDDEGKRVPVGILTDRDIVVGAAAEGRQLSALQVGDVAGDDLIKSREDEDLRAVVKRMKSYGVRRVPVVDRAGSLVGIIAFDDVVLYLSDQLHDLATMVEREQALERQLRD
jgi:CBS domain-containing protein